MRLFKTILILAVLVLLPALSWVYLTKGRDWRRERVEELGVYGKLPAFDVKTMAGSNLNEKILNGKNLVVHNSMTGTSLKIFAGLHKQFNERDDYVFLQFGDQLATENLTEDPEQWHFVYCPENDSCRDLRGLFKNAELTTALIDKSGNVRRFYNLNDQSDAKKLVEHMAILIPIERRARLQLKRDMEKEEGDAGK